MNIFSEIYGAYYLAVSKILEKETLSREDVKKIIDTYAFKDSYFFMEPKIFPNEDISDWGLLKANPDKSYSPVLKNKPVRILSAVQKSFLKSSLNDKKAKLFFDDETISRLSERLSNEKDLRKCEDFKYFDVFTDGDNYKNPSYRKHFKTILNAVKTHEILKISFTSGKGEKKFGYYLPSKIEYSRKNDKFRAYCFTVKNDSLEKTAVINIGRITRISGTGKNVRVSEADVKKQFDDSKSKEPVVLEVSSERNGIERFMTEFAGYEKRAETDTASGICRVYLWYDIHDRTEVLISILGFGPVVKILAPESFKREARERITKQFELIKNFKESEVNEC